MLVITNTTKILNAAWLRFPSMVGGSVINKILKPVPLRALLIGKEERLRGTFRPLED